MIKNIFKGFIIGIGKIIPGVSGSMLAISMGVYERALLIVSRIRSSSRADFWFVISLVIGVFIGICMFSRGVDFLLDKWYFVTMLFFVGLIISGIPDIVKECEFKGVSFCVKLRYIIIFICAFCFSYFLTVLGSDSFDIGSSWGESDIGFSLRNVFVFFVIGVLEAFSSIVPGISGTAIFMSLGCYEMLLSFYENIFNPGYWGFGLVFFAGVIFGIVILAKVITYLLGNYKTNTYMAIFGFMVASLFVMLLMAFDGVYFTGGVFSFIWVVVESVVIVFFGYCLGRKINKILAND